MRKFSLSIMILAVAGLMTMVSCRKPVNEIKTPEGGRMVTLHATTETGSKTSLTGRTVLWSEGDKVSVNGDVFTLIDGEGTQNGTFNGKITTSAPYGIGYPAESTTFEAGPRMFINMPASYSYDPDNIVIPMATVITDEIEDEFDLNFQNMVNVLKLTLTGDNTEASELTSIVLTSEDDASFLNGKMEIGMYGAEYITEGTNTTTVNFDDHLELETEAQDVYIVLPKIHEGVNLKIRFNAANGGYIEKTIVTNNYFCNYNNLLPTAELEVVADPPLYLFTVSAGNDGTHGTDDDVKVVFSPGNLYYDASDNDNHWKFEESSIDYRTLPGSYCCIGETYYGATPEGDFGALYWSTDPDDAHTTSWDHFECEEGDHLFTNSQVSGDAHAGEPNPDFHVNGETGTNEWRTLTAAEWAYLLGLTTPGRDPSLTCGWVDSYYSVGIRVPAPDNDEGYYYVKGAFLFPDGYSGPSLDEYLEEYVYDLTLEQWHNDFEPYGVVFLPNVCDRFGPGIGAGDVNYYWTSTTYSGYTDDYRYAYYANATMNYYGYFESFNWTQKNRDGLAIRLVKNAPSSK